MRRLFAAALAALFLASAADAQGLNIQPLAVDAVERYDVMQWGADKTGVLDTAAALNTATTGMIALLPTAGAQVYFPAGTYKLGSNVTIPANSVAVLDPGVTFTGAGSLLGPQVTLNATGAWTQGLSGKATTTHGTNATAGVSTLASGTVTVSTTAAAAIAAAGAAGDVIVLVLQSCSSCGTLSVGTVTPGTSFVINSTNASDASKVYWEIRHLN